MGFRGQIEPHLNFFLPEIGKMRTLEIFTSHFFFLELDESAQFQFVLHFDRLQKQEAQLKAPRCWI